MFDKLSGPFQLFLNILLKYKNLLLEGVGSLFVLHIFTLITPLIFMAIVDKVIPHNGFETLDVLILALLILNIFELGLDILTKHLLFHTTVRVTTELSVCVFRQLMNLPLHFYENHQVGDIVAKFNCIESLKEFLGEMPIKTLLDCLFGVIFFLILYNFSPKLTFIALSAVPFHFALSLFGNKIFTGIFQKILKIREKNQATLNESLAGIQTIKASNSEKYFLEQWKNEVSEDVFSMFRKKHVENIFQFLAGFMEKITTLLIWWIGVKLVIAHELTLGQYMVFIMFIEKAIGPIFRQQFSI